ncbi:hypothetical protein Cgig2_023374 [Carnegiea gigantea]|uniref:Uncharacterized protein n=1 Tax=Carnegiea gigantea TaxID=171969 RepID=A0A9Q1GJG6_9CARY|nr:hypothetical protein Cgig2_023374 [Carnegiea gigantea]
MDFGQAYTNLQSEIWGLSSTCTKEKPLVSSSEKRKTKVSEVFQSLSALRSIIDIYNLSIIGICWLSSKIEEMFGVVETAGKIEKLADVDQAKVLSDQDLTCSSEITYFECQLNNLSSEASKLKLKALKSLREKEYICKIREDLTIQQQSVIEAESKLKSSLDSKKKKMEQVQADLVADGLSKLQDLEKQKEHLKNLVGFVISFSNV